MSFLLLETENNCYVKNVLFLTDANENNTTCIEFVELNSAENLQKCKDFLSTKPRLKLKKKRDENVTLN